jgi:hypothetical protein
VASIRVVLSSGALEASPAIRSNRKLKFKLLVGDAAKHRFKITRKVRPQR